MNSDQNITATFQKQSSGGGSSGGGGGGGGCFINMIGNHSEKETVVIRSHNFYNNFMAWGLLLLSGIAAFQWQLIKRSRQ
jgi:galactokinase